MFVLPKSNKKPDGDNVVNVSTPAPTALSTPQQGQGEALMLPALVVDLQVGLQALEGKQRDPVSILITGIGVRIGGMN
jgi:hypothetical protein